MKETKKKKNKSVLIPIMIKNNPSFNQKKIKNTYPISVCRRLERYF